MSKSNRYVRRVDEYLVRWEEGNESETHIVAILWDNKIHEAALCGFTPANGWGKRGGSIKITEPKCAECAKRARLIGILT